MPELNPSEPLSTATADTPITVDGKSGYVLLASGNGDDDTGGGMFSYDGQTVERVDWLSSTGLHYEEGQLSRLLWSSGEVGAVGEMIVYDEKGVLRYYRLDELSEPHDVAWDGENFVLVSTMTNTVLWMSPGGEVVKRWKAPGDGDCWHLNSILFHEDKMYLSAFGRFPRHRAWAEPGARDGAGIVFDPETGEDVLTGLTAPHNPRMVDGRWIVCNSYTSELLAIDPASKEVTHRLPMGGWVRGIAVADEFIYVGVSANRKKPVAPWTASIAVLRRGTLEEVERFELPSTEVYDLVLVPYELYQGVKRGFYTNPVRVKEQSQYELFRAAGVEPVRLWGIGHPLPAEACRVEFELNLPEVQPALAVGEVPCRIHNRGGAILVSAPPHPTNICFRWRSPTTDEVIEEGVRTPLPQPLVPGEPLDCRFKLVTPMEPGDYMLEVTLVQEDVRWFDEVDENNAWRQRIRIE